MGFWEDLGSSLPVVGGFFDDSDDQAREQLRRNQALYGNIALPDAPDNFRYEGDYAPETVRANLVQEDPALRQRQMDLLAKMAGYADTGLSDVDALGYTHAANLGAKTAQTGNSAAMQNAQARGVAGGGLEFAMREAANQAGSNRAQDAGLQTAADAARQRALYAQAYGSGLSAMRNQDYNVNSGNTDILNRFNQANAATRNQAQLRNLDARQSLSNANIGQRNDYRQQNFNNQITRAGGQAQANTGYAQGLYAQNAARTANRNQNTQIAMAMMGGGGGGAGAAGAGMGGMNGDDYYMKYAGRAQ